MNRNTLTTEVLRVAYLLGMYTGIRAGVNCFRSVFLPLPRAAVIDRTTIHLNKSVSCNVRVHAKNFFCNSGGTRVGGMISVSLEAPGIPDRLYSLLRITSHFGCGHIELAFYEEHDSVCLFAVRNMLRSNLERFGRTPFCGNLSLLTERDEIEVLTQILHELKMHNLSVYLAPPAECVDLAVTPWLLRQNTRSRVIAALTRKYERLARLVSAPRQATRTPRRAG